MKILQLLHSGDRSPKLVFLNIFLLLIYCNTLHAQTEAEKESAWKHVDKTLHDQLEIANLLKDANSKKKATDILAGYSNVQSLDSIDLEISNDKVVSISFYEKNEFYLYKNKFSVIYDSKTKKTSVNKTANMDLKGLIQGDLRKSTYYMSKDLPNGLRLLFRRDL